MRSTFHKLLLAIPLALLFSAACFAQTTMIVGDVKGPDGKLLAGAQVQIVRTDIKANYKVKTDKKGHYVYAGLPIGTFNVSVEVDGKTADQMNGVKTRSGPTLRKSPSTCPSPRQLQRRPAPKLRKPIAP